MDSQLSSTPKGDNARFQLPDPQNVMKLLKLYESVCDKIEEERAQLAGELRELKLKQKVLADQLADLLNKPLSEPAQVAYKVKSTCG